MESDSSGDEEPMPSTQEAPNASFYTLNHSGRKIKSVSDSKSFECCQSARCNSTKSNYTMNNDYS